MYELNKILFLDIETVPQYASFEELSNEFKDIWIKKASIIDNEKSPSDLYFEKAGIYSEYGKVIVISIGFFSQTDEKLAFRIKTLANHDEKKLLLSFKKLLEDKFTNSKYRFCAHNGKEFDYPYLCRRMIVNKIALPKILQIMGRKPWEVPHLDTLQLWKFGDYKYYTSLETLTTIFGIPTSKDEIDGSQISYTYYTENKFDVIKKYCAKDVISTAKVYLAFYNLGELQDENITFIH